MEVSSTGMAAASFGGSTQDFPWKLPLLSLKPAWKQLPRKKMTTSMEAVESSSTSMDTSMEASTASTKAIADFVEASIRFHGSGECFRGSGGSFR